LERLTTIQEANGLMDRSELLAWLREDHPQQLPSLWCNADAARQNHVGDEVYLRGLIEISNHCVRHCAYCGLRVPNRDVRRYRMEAAEILRCARRAADLGYGTVVLQSGEDPGLTKELVADIVRQIKVSTGLAVALSLGERTIEELAAWRAAGADRYLLRFETSNRRLYDAIHPPLAGAPSNRIALLRSLRDLGYEVGSGVMVGIPGQTHDHLADDLEWFVRLDLDMIGIGPFIPHPATPLGQPLARALRVDQVPNTEGMTYKMIALSRLLCPWANIPATTALATLNPRSGWELGLSRGANVVMPNLTPAAYRCHYDIYPAKACIQETGCECPGGVEDGIIQLGRCVGQGRGDSPNHLRRQAPASQKV